MRAMCLVACGVIWKNKNMNDIRNLFKLPADEKLDLVDALLDSLGDKELPPLSDAMKVEIEERLAEHDADPSSAIPWETMRAELRSRFNYHRRDPAVWRNRT